MIRNTGDLLKILKVWVGGLTIFTAAVAGYAITRGIRRLKKYRRPFDMESLEEVTGKIVEVIYSKESSYDSRGVILFLSVKEEILEVHLGPSWYIKRQFKSFKHGEEITVTGSEVGYGNKEIIVAQILERGNKKFQLRDQQGSPFWESRIE